MCRRKAVCFLLWEALSTDWTVTIITPGTQKPGRGGDGSLNYPSLPKLQLTAALWGSLQILEGSGPWSICCTPAQCILRAAKDTNHTKSQQFFLKDVDFLTVKESLIIYQRLIQILTNEAACTTWKAKRQRKEWNWKIMLSQPSFSLQSMKKFHDTKICIMRKISVTRK